MARPSRFRDGKVEISGHTDSTGDRDHDIDLSKRRADVVKQFLLDEGLGSAITTSPPRLPDAWT